MWTFVSHVSQFISQSNNTPPDWFTSIKNKLADFAKNNPAPNFIVPDTTLTNNYIGKLFDVISPKKAKIISERDSIEGGVHYFKFNETNNGFYVPDDFVKFVFEKWKREAKKSDKIVLDDTKVDVNAKIIGASAELVKNVPVYQNGEIRVDILTEIVSISPSFSCMITDITSYLPDNDIVKEGKRIHESRKKKKSKS